MEPEVQRDRAREQQKRTSTFAKDELLRQQKSTATTQTITRSYARETDVAMGLMFLMIALIGMVVTDLMSAHLSFSHNIIHLVSGVLALVFGFRSEAAAKTFAYGFGAVYGLLGILGFVFGKTGTATVAHMASDRFLWVLSPEILELGTADHILHIIFGAIFIAGALILHKRKITSTTKEI